MDVIDIEGFVTAFTSVALAGAAVFCAETGAAVSSAAVASMRDVVMRI